jgi:6-phosphogluconolactonase
VAAGDFLVFVSCADSGEVHRLHLSADGQLSTAQVVSLGGQLMPMALSPDHAQLYVARRSDPLAVIALAVAADDGALQALGESALPASMASLNPDHTGRWLFSASYGPTWWPCRRWVRMGRPPIR